MALRLQPRVAACLVAGVLPVLAACSSSPKVITKADCSGPTTNVVYVSDGLGRSWVYRQPSRVWESDTSSCETLRQYWTNLHPRVSPYCVVIAPLAANATYTRADAKLFIYPKHATVKMGDGC